MALIENYFCRLAVIIFISSYQNNMPEHKSELEREFELERLILFSDAVFAIAITLLIIEIKFPEVGKGDTTSEIFTAFKPVIIRFLAFTLSFIFIGITWARHLQLCRYIKKYNNGLIRRNLVLLFFVVCFPFSASGLTEHIRPSFMLPIFVYMINIAGVVSAQLALAHYIFYKKPALSINGLEAEKHYMYLKYKWSTFIFLAVFVLYVVLSIFFNQQSFIPALDFYLIPLLLVIMRKRIKKYKPASADEE